VGDFTEELIHSIALAENVQAVCITALRKALLQAAAAILAQALLPRRVP